MSKDKLQLYKIGLGVASFVLSASIIFTSDEVLASVNAEEEMAKTIDVSEKEPSISAENNAEDSITTSAGFSVGEENHDLVDDSVVEEKISEDIDSNVDNLDLIDKLIEENNDSVVKEKLEDDFTESEEDPMKHLEVDSLSDNSDLNGVSAPQEKTHYTSNFTWGEGKFKTYMKMIQVNINLLIFICLKEPTLLLINV